MSLFSVRLRTCLPILLYLTDLIDAAFTQINVPFLPISPRPTTIKCSPAQLDAGPRSQALLLALSMLDDLFVDSGETLRAGDFHVPGADGNVLDRNGKEFSVGAVVRVCVEGTKTFQIPSKGCGVFDENKNFVPQSEEPDFERRSLVLPVGLRGIVSKVYDDRTISANYPIQVKFETGGNTEEGYDVPVTFTMHFMAHELECVN